MKTLRQILCVNKIEWNDCQTYHSKHLKHAIMIKNENAIRTEAVTEIGQLFDGIRT